MYSNVYLLVEQEFTNITVLLDYRQYFFPLHSGKKKKKSKKKKGEEKMKPFHLLTTFKIEERRILYLEE